MSAAGIGTLKESSLHSEIKNWYQQDGDQVEGRYGGYTIDILRGDLVIEVQTRSFNKLLKKLNFFLPENQVRVIYPIPQIKWISRSDVTRHFSVSRRRSPKIYSVYCLFDELVYLAAQLDNPNFSLEILLIEQEDIWINDNKGSWRRKHWSIYDRHLLSVLRRIHFNKSEDYRALLPADLGSLFSSHELSIQAGIPLRLARRMLYCLARMGLIKLDGVKNRRRYYSLE